MAQLSCEAIRESPFGRAGERWLREWGRRPNVAEVTPLTGDPRLVLASAQDHAAESDHLGSSLRPAGTRHGHRLGSSSGGGRKTGAPDKRGLGYVRPKRAPLPPPI